MSTYDYFKNPSTNQYDQIKCWYNEFRLFKIGDHVPDVDFISSYDVVMREGYYIRVRDNKIQDTSDTSALDHSVPAFDKWGDPFTGQTTGLLPNEPYFFPKSEV